MTQASASSIIPLRVGRGSNAVYDVIVIGLGAAGAATLSALAASGARVRGLDRFNSPHALGSSHGQSRITRQAIGEGSAYVPLAVRSQQIWRELEAEGDEALFSQVGCLILSDPEDRNERPPGQAFIDRTLAAAREHGVAHELLDTDAIRGRYPQFVVRDEVAGYFEASSGFLHVEACIRAQLGRAQRAGAEVSSLSRVASVRQEADHVVTTLADGEKLLSQRAVVSAGAWTASLLGPPFDTLLSTTRQVMHWFPTAAGAEVEGAWSRSPVFIWRHGSGRDDFFYGFPSLGGQVKVADEAYGPGVPADTVDRATPASDSRRMFDAHVRGRLQSILPEPAFAAACLYTVTPDSHFIIDRHPDHPRIEVVSACSGHGFKHAAAIGEAVAEKLTHGASRIDLSFFALSRFAESAP